MRTTHRITTTAAIMLSLAAASAPAASARPTDLVPMGKQMHSAVYSRPDKLMIAVGSPSSAATLAKASAPQAAVRIQTRQNRFEWGDAGIGAASVLALAMLALGFGLVISQRRGRHGAA
jgi:hypothetical protein